MLINAKTGIHASMNFVETRSHGFFSKNWATVIFCFSF